MKLEIKYCPGSAEFNEPDQWVIFYWEEEIINESFPRHIRPIQRIVATVPCCREEDVDVAKDMVAFYNLAQENKNPTLYIQAADEQMLGDCIATCLNCFKHMPWIGDDYCKCVKPRWSMDSDAIRRAKEKKDK